MGKQAEGHAQKALDSPCADLYQASLRCESLKCTSHQQSNKSAFEPEALLLAVFDGFYN